MQNFKTFVIAIAVAFTFVMTGCETKEKPLTNEHNAKNLVVLVYDITASDSSYAKLSEDALSKLYAAISASGGGYFVPIVIKNKSTEQDVEAYPIAECDTISLDINNIYQKKRLIEMNSEKKQECVLEQRKFVEAMGALLLRPRDEKKSDVCGALGLANTTLSSATYSDFRKTLIVVSDLKDNVNKNYSPEIAFESFPADVEIVCVRPAIAISNAHIVTSVAETVHFFSLK